MQELPIGGQGPLLHVGHGGHQRTIAGVLARLRLGRQRCPWGPRPRRATGEQIAFADPMAFLPAVGCEWLPGPASARSSQARVADGVALGRDGRSLGGARPNSWSRLGCWAKSRTNERIDAVKRSATSSAVCCSRK